MAWGGVHDAYLQDHVSRMHHDIEVMTRRLELEKRRLQRLDKELGGAKAAYEQKMLPYASKKSTSAFFPQGGNGVQADSSLNCSDKLRALPSVDKAAPHADLSSVAALSTTLRVAENAFMSAAHDHNSGPRSSSPAGRRGGDGSSTARSAPIRALRSRLETQRRKLDHCNHDVRDFRNQVDAVRRERTQLNDIFQGLTLEISERTAQLSDFVEETASGRTVRSEAAQRVCVMKKRQETERAQFKSEVLRLSEQLKFHDWEKKEVEVRLRRNQVGSRRRELQVADEEAEFTEHGMMRKILKLAFLNCIQRRHISKHQKNIEVFEQAFATIKQSTGIDHIEDIVKIFVNLESRNYSLLTYVNHMHREIETLEGTRQARVDSEIKGGEDRRRSEEARQKALGDAKRAIVATQTAVEESHDDHASHREIFERVKPLLLQIAERLQEEQQRLVGAAPPAAPGDRPLRVPSELREENIPEWLSWIEQTLGRWRDLLPAPRGPQKAQPFPCTAAEKVKMLAPKRSGQQVPPPLLKASELPSSTPPEDSNTRDVQKRHGHKPEDDLESDEEDFDHPLTLQDLKDRAAQSLQRKRRGPNKRAALLNVPDRGARGAAGAADAAGHSGRAATLSPDSHEKGGEASLALGASKPVASAGDEAANAAPNRPETRQRSRRDSEDKESSSEEGGEKVEPSEDELNDIFLKRYKMSKEEIQAMADKMGIALSNLCYLKTEFDMYDKDRSGYIDARELRELLSKLGEELTDEELEQSFRDLDADGSGEIEFFEFVEWFTSED